MNELLGRIRSVLDKSGVSNRIIEPDTEDETPDIVFTLGKDDDCNEDVIVMISFSEDMILLQAFMDGYKLDSSHIPDAILFCNTWTTENYMPALCISEDGMIFSRWCYVVTDEVSDKYISDAMLVLFVQSSWRFFCEFSKEFLD